MASQAAASSDSLASKQPYIGVLDPAADRNDVRRSVHEGSLSKFTESQRLEAVGWFPGDGPPQPWYLPAAIAHQERHEDVIDELNYQKAKELTKFQ